MYSDDENYQQEEQGYSDNYEGQYDGYENYEDYEDDNYEYDNQGDNEEYNNNNEMNNNLFDENIDNNNNQNDGNNDVSNNKNWFKMPSFIKKLNVNKIINFIPLKKKSNQNNQSIDNSFKQNKPKKEKKKNRKKSSPLSKKLLFIIAMVGLLLMVSIKKQMDDERALENKPTNTSSKVELTSAELYQQKVSHYSPILNKTLYTLNDKTLNIKIHSNLTTDGEDKDTHMQVITNTKGNQIFFKVSYTNNAVITVFSENDVYVALTNAKSTLQKPIKLYHSVVNDELIRNKIYNQYVNIDVLNKQLKNSISFNYKTTKVENDIEYDVLTLNVPRYEVVESSINKENQNNDNGVDTTIAGNGGLSVIKPTSQTEQMLIYINPETNEIYKIQKSINELDYTIIIENNNQLSVTLDASIEEIDEQDISMVLAGEINYSRTN